MISFLSVAGSWMLLVLAMELVLWWLFKGRVANICFQFAKNPSRCPIVVLRLRMIVIFHTLALCSAIFVAHLFLW